MVDVGEGFSVLQVADNTFYVTRNGKCLPNHAWKKREYAISKFKRIK